MAVTDPAPDTEPTASASTPPPRRRRIGARPESAEEFTEPEAAPEAVTDAALASPGPAVGEPAVRETPESGDGSTAAGGTQDHSDGGAAFRDVHERRLHGFALLLTLGDRSAAAELARAALREAEPRIEELGHPERGAVWLRRHVLKHAPKRADGGGRGPFRRSRPAPHSPDGIAEIGADGVLVEALARLDLQSRAALILQDVERFREVDVADALGTDRRAVEKLVREARAKYSQAYTAAAARHGTDETLQLPEDVRRAANPGLPRRE